MRKKITYLNCALTVIAVALTVIVLQNAKIIQPAKAQINQVVDVNIKEVGNFPVFGVVPIEIKRVNQKVVVPVETRSEK